jgi:hypothetical protein
MERLGRNEDPDQRRRLSSAVSEVSLPCGPTAFGWTHPVKWNLREPRKRPAGCETRWWVRLHEGDQYGGAVCCEAGTGRLLGPEAERTSLSERGRQVVPTDCAESTWNDSCCVIDGSDKKRSTRPTRAVERSWRERTRRVADHERPQGSRPQTAVRFSPLPGAQTGNGDRSPLQTPPKLESYLGLVPRGRAQLGAQPEALSKLRRPDRRAARLGTGNMAAVDPAELALATAGGLQAVPPTLWLTASSIVEEASRDGGAGAKAGRASSTRICWPN